MRGTPGQTWLSGAWAWGRQVSLCAAAPLPHARAPGPPPRILAARRGVHPLLPSGEAGGSPPCLSLTVRPYCVLGRSAMCTCPRRPLPCASLAVDRWVSTLPAVRVRGR